MKKDAWVVTVVAVALFIAVPFSTPMYFYDIKNRFRILLLSCSFSKI